ncbi:hypothetical protein B0H16DRAFT_1474382 [Mycena metata]|uniref:Ricin B lectin domain-containing protein n=1 Tax=Mycena metata TaxID=1033252 RepID=A0AAD7MKI2_9AGAR|nr:hypothetical protein B0H16DRAFT_1474382 [Mycena metata]
MSLPEGIYLITNVKARIAVDLEGGAAVQAWEAPTGNKCDITLLNKLWLVKPTQRKDLQTYSICNLRGGIYMSMSLDEEDRTSVEGQRPEASQFGATPETLHQEWQFMKVGDSYRIQNAKAKTSLNLESGKEANGTPIIVWGDSDTTNQLWNLKSYSATYDDILAALQDSPYGMDDFKYSPFNTLYFVVPQSLLEEIWNATALPARPTEGKPRSRTFLGDDYAIGDQFLRTNGLRLISTTVAFKAAVNDWAFYNIKADHFSPLCGVHVGERHTDGEDRAYNWTLSEDRKNVLFFEYNQDVRLENSNVNGQSTTYWSTFFDKPSRRKSNTMPSGV